MAAIIRGECRKSRIVTYLFAKVSRKFRVNFAKVGVGTRRQEHFLSLNYLTFILSNLLSPSLSLSLSLTLTLSIFHLTLSLSLSLSLPHSPSLSHSLTLAVCLCLSLSLPLFLFLLLNEPLSESCTAMVPQKFRERIFFS